MSTHPCPPPTPGPCPSVCPPPPPPPECRPKPIMRGLHWKQTMGHLVKGFLTAGLAGFSYYFFVAQPRKAAYTEYYKRAEFPDQADEMARKGLFQSVPK